MIEALLTKKATWLLAGVTAGLLGPFVSSTLQDIALLAAAFAAVGFIFARVLLPLIRLVIAGIQTPPRLDRLEQRIDARMDALEQRIDAFLAHHHDT